MVNAKFPRLAGMSEGWMSDIMCKAGRFYEIGINESIRGKK